MISRNLRSNQESPPDKTYEQGRMLRIEPHPEGGTPASAIIFRDDALLILNHQDRSYFRMDENTLSKLTSQISAAMEQIRNNWPIFRPTRAP